MPSAVGTVVGGDAGRAFTTGLSEISLDGVSLGRVPCALCFLALPSLSVNPTAHSQVLCRIMAAGAGC